MCFDTCLSVNWQFFWWSLITIWSLGDVGSSMQSFFPTHHWLAEHDARQCVVVMATARKQITAVRSVKVE